MMLMRAVSVALQIDHDANWAIACYGGQSHCGAGNSGDAAMTVETILRRKGTDVATIEPDASIRRAADWLCSISSMPDLTVTGALTAGKAAYAMAKLGPADIDAVELYDAFTINTILFLEDLGFCKKGEGGAFVSGGRIAPNGSLAVNTN